MLRIPPGLVSGLALAVLAGCEPPPSAPDLPVPPPVDPARFVAVVDNPLFPLPPGALLRFRRQDDTETWEVLPHRQAVQGVQTTVVRERVWRGGAPVEETLAYYAQDKDGDVWLFGEEDLLTDEGEASWTAGVEGARAGVVMWARPVVGQRYRQNFAPGRAEDVGTVMRLDATVTVPYGRLTGCLMTEEASVMDPADRETKYFCPGVGPVLTVEGGSRTELTARSAGPRP